MVFVRTLRGSITRLYVRQERWLAMKYEFEMNDIRAIWQVINVILVMQFGLVISWFGLGIATAGLIGDFLKPAKDKRLNSFIMHGVGMVLNAYLLTLL